MEKEEEKLFTHVGWLVASLFTIHHRWPPKNIARKEQPFVCSEE